MPKIVLCIDEFKGNFKYQVALFADETHKIVDIIECRHKHFLCSYFKKFPKEQLDNVKYLVIDLWESLHIVSTNYLNLFINQANNYIILGIF